MTGLKPIARPMAATAVTLSLTVALAACSSSKKAATADKPRRRR